MSQAVYTQAFVMQKGRRSWTPEARNPQCSSLVCDSFYTPNISSIHLHTTTEQNKTGFYSPFSKQKKKTFRKKWAGAISQSTIGPKRISSSVHFFVYFSNVTSCHTKIRWDFAFFKPVALSSCMVKGETRSNTLRLFKSLIPSRLLWALLPLKVEHQQYTSVLEYLI